MSNGFEVQARFTAKDETSATYAKLTQSTRSLRAELARLSADQKVADAQAKLAANNTLKNAQALERAQGRQMIAANQAKIAQLKALQQMEGGYTKLASTGTGAMTALSGAISGGVVASLAAATAGAIALGNALGDASKRELASVRSATALGREFGISRGEATKLNQSITREVLTQNPAFASNDLALQLSNLFSDDIGKAVGKNNVAKTTGQFASKFAALMTGDEGNIGQLTNVLSDVLSGGQTVSQLKQRDIFNSTGINKVLIPMLQKAGIDNLGDIDMAKRLGFVMAALNEVATDESLQAQAKTVAGQWAQAQKNLFDPFSGFLGVERDLGNGQSVFESFKRTIGLLFGDDGLFAQFGKLMGDFDPMRVLNQGLTGLNGFLEIITGALKEGDSAEIGYAVGKFAAEFFNNLLKQTYSIDWGQVAIGVAYGLGSFLSNFDWGGLIQRAGFVPMVVTGVVNLGSKLFEACAKGGSEGFNQLVSQITQGATQLGSIALSQLVAGGQIIGTAISNLFNQISSTISNAIASVPSQIGNAASAAVSATPLGMAANAAKSILGRAEGQLPGNIMGVIASEMRKAPGTTPVIANSGELILNPTQIPDFIQSIRSQSDRTLNIDLGGLSVSSTNDLDAIIEAINYRLRLELRGRLT